MWWKDCCRDVSNALEAQYQDGAAVRRMVWHKDEQTDVHFIHDLANMWQTHGSTCAQKPLRRVSVSPALRAAAPMEL